MNSVVWNNYNLKPAQSANYDLYFSFYNNTIGLFTAGGFIKEIKDMIFATNGRYVFESEDYPGIPSSAEGRPISTTLNNPNKVKLWGLEFDWQTHFWYLPGVLSGLVANVNYTHIFSEAKYPLSRVEIQYLEEPPYIIRTVIDTFYTNRFISQPRDIVNFTIGYDYKDFSTRVSMFYQTDIFKEENVWDELTASADDYVRWDLSVKQTLPWYSVQLFLNINNITSAMDVDLNKGRNKPTSEQHYGMTADIGVHWTL
ncbi:MAG TPA: TonB-dependent receptor [Ignavibacteriales bacterium]|nr:TonB-dependent receptor [Ignavibacteriales bacterium]